MRCLALFLLLILPLPALAQDYYDFSNLTVEDAASKPLVLMKPAGLPIDQLTWVHLCTHEYLNTDLYGIEHGSALQSAFDTLSERIMTLSRENEVAGQLVNMGLGWDKTFLKSYQTMDNQNVTWAPEFLKTRQCLDQDAMFFMKHGAFVFQSDLDAMLTVKPEMVDKMDVVSFGG